MMKKTYNFITICMLSFALFFSGCGGTAISLEEALMEVDKVEITTTDLETEMTETPTEIIVVYVCGKVILPGVYELPKGSRIVAAIEAAGGFAENAAREAINLAEALKDGMQINVPGKEEAAQVNALMERQKQGLVNINQASVQDLCTLPGIGEAKALSIINYRSECGLFQSIEDIQNVSGIGESLYLQIKDKIYID